MRIFPKLKLRLRRAPAIIRPDKEWRMKTRDVATAMQFRMGGGFAGAVNRSHPATVIPHQGDSAIPPTFFGCGVMVNAAKNGVRLVQPGDAAPLFGVTSRPFPFQQGQANVDFAPANIGTAAPLVGMAIDVLKSGYIMVPVVGTPGLGDPVFIWTAATALPHVQGGFEAVNPGGSGFAVTNAYFNGLPDSVGVGEIAFNV